MDPRTVASRSLVDGAVSAFISALLPILSLGCGDDAGDPQAWDAASKPGETTPEGADSSPSVDPSSAGGGSFPAQAEACKLTLNVSNEDELRAIFGKAGELQQEQSGNTLGYVFDDQSRWLFFFNMDHIWSGFTIQADGATVVAPGCWAPDGGYWQRPDGGFWQRPDGGYRAR
jgi:hypothetical protein